MVMMLYSGSITCFKKAEGWPAVVCSRLRPLRLLEYPGSFYEQLNTEGMKEKLTRGSWARREHARDIDVCAYGSQSIWMICAMKTGDVSI
jgi:hypothetical protein